MVLYGAIAVWSIAVIIRSWRANGFSINRVDILFCTFLLWVLGSVATHWWKGTIQYLELMPFFVILPYLLGRMMDAQDVQLFKKLLIGMAGVLLLDHGTAPASGVRNSLSTLQSRLLTHLT